MENLYATAIQRLVSSGMKEEAVMKNLMAHLKQRGRVKLLPAILGSLKTLVARSVTLGASVEVAKKGDEKKAIAEAAALGIEVSEASVNPILLSGWRARSEGTLIDRSGKRALTDMYRSIVKA